MTIFPNRCATALLLAASLLMLNGCPATESATDQSPANSPAESETRVESADDRAEGDVAQLAQAVAADETAAESDEAGFPSEVWDVSYMQDSKVGTFHTTIKPLDADGTELVEIKQEGKLTLVRFGQKVEQAMDFSSIETPAGEVVRFGASMSAATASITMQGKVIDRSADVSIDSLGKRSETTMEWDPSVGGFFAAEMNLRRDPLLPGETRSFKALMPLPTNVSIADVTLTAGDYEKTKLLEGEAELLKIDVSMKTGGPGDMDFTIWTDRRGESIKQYVPGMDLTTYRVSSKFAKREPAQGFDIGKFSTVPLRKPLPNAAGTKRVVYKLTHANGAPADYFPNSGSQQVKSTGKNVAELTVIAVRPDSPSKLAVDPKPPTDADLGSNNLIQSDDAEVVKMARAVKPKETDPWTLAQALEQAVFTNMTAKNFSQAFATAAEVARTREGDCTEHAVLLAAMCRARKIPARVAIGLVYYAPMKGFAYHMWNEVWIKDRWVPLDATLGLGGIGGDHIKLADSNLEGADGYSTFLPVAKVMGQLQIEVVEAE
jgi:hypothetical protein